MLKSDNIIGVMRTLVMFMIDCLKICKNAKPVIGLYLLEHKTQLLDQWYPSF